MDDEEADPEGADGGARGPREGGGVRPGLANRTPSKARGGRAWGGLRVCRPMGHRLSPATRPWGSRKKGAHRSCETPILFTALHHRPLVKTIGRIWGRNPTDRGREWDGISTGIRQIPRRSPTAYTPTVRRAEGGT